MLDNQASTSWTPAKGDVLGWPFVWLKPNSQVKERPAFLLPFDETRVMLIGLSNIQKCQSVNPLLVRWTSVLGSRKTSVVALDMLGVNVVPRDVIPEHDSQGHACVWGDADDKEFNKIERHVVGGLVGGWRYREIRGVQWVEPQKYQRIRIRHERGRGLVSEPVQGEPLLEGLV